MPETVGPPAEKPCGSCPYRTDVPPGVWAASEYDKLPHYDQPTYAQPPGVFLCHLFATSDQQRLCAGWVACHDMDHNLAIRMALASHLIAPGTADEIFDYTTSVPVFGSGQEAADHGLSKIDDPPPAAEAAWQKIIRARPDVAARSLRGE